ncbi:MAG: hypothetical protein IKQ22_00825 [Clostridia bacterium]|nr:hypothetical protein [Clostridia bacterium]
MYRTEAEFSKALTARLKREHIRVTRIESHGTGNGIPDMFVDGRGIDTFLELKNDPTHSINSKNIKVAWRPGQKAWMFEYHTKHITKSCLTLVACKDGLVIIPMTSTFPDDKVYDPQVISYEDLKTFRLYRILEAMQDYFLVGTFKETLEGNYLDYVNAFVDEFYPGIDYDPECLWDPDLLDKHANISYFNEHKLNMILTLEATILNSKEKEDG